MRKTSRRRHSRRKVRMNRRAVRRLVRNILGVSALGDVVIPVLGAVAGYVGVRLLGDAITETTLPFVGGNPNAGRAASGAVLGASLLYAAPRVPFLGEHQNPLLIGASIALAQPVVERAVASVTPVDQPPAPRAPAPEAEPQGAGAYYSERSLGALIDISRAGAPYRGMLGLGDPGDQSVVEDHLDRAEEVSIVTPTDLAKRAISVPAFPRVRERMAGSPGDRGYAGGTFARMLFSGMS